MAFKADLKVTGACTVNWLHTTYGGLHLSRENLAKAPSLEPSGDKWNVHRKGSSFEHKLQGEI